MGHLGFAEDARPFPEGEIGGDDHRGVLKEAADQVEQQLPAGLAEGRVGPHELHPIVAEPHIGDPHRYGDAIGQHHRVAPGELTGLAGIEARRRKGRRQSWPCPA